jgi:parallel beta-helix repeat protein
MRYRFALRLISCFGLFLALPALAATLVVDNDLADCPQASFTSIQEAVLAANPGDKILVCPGTYVETVAVTAPRNDLRIEAQGAPGEVILQAPTPTAASFAGFLLQGVSGVLIQGFTVEGFFEANILLSGGSSNTIRKNLARLSSHHDGIQVSNSSGNVIEHNVSGPNLIANACGVNVVGSGSIGNVVRHNALFQNDFGAQAAGGARDNTFFNNESHDNRLIGIRTVGPSNANLIENNHVFKNRQGIVLLPNAAGVSATGVTVRNNRVENNEGPMANQGNGVLLINANGNLVEKNDIRNNGRDGISLENADSNTVQINLVRENGRDGIFANSLSVTNTIERNVMRENAEHDAHDDSVGPGTSGTANFWINNKCETENKPGLCKNP